MFKKKKQEKVVEDVKATKSPVQGTTVTVNVDPAVDPGVNHLVSDKLPSLND